MPSKARAKPPRRTQPSRSTTPGGRPTVRSSIVASPAANNAAKISDECLATWARVDLEAAGIAYFVEGPDGLEYADFHSLRHSYLTLGGRAGIDLRTLQELAGHSDPKLTARYSHRRLYDLAGAVDKLPNLVPSISPVASNASEIPLRMTGTDGDFGVVPGVVDCDFGVVPGVVTGGIGLHRTALKYTLGIFDETSGGSAESLEMKQTGAVLHRSAVNCISEGDGTRTRNLRIDSPILTCCKA